MIEDPSLYHVLKDLTELDLSLRESLGLFSFISLLLIKVVLTNSGKSLFIDSCCLQRYQA